MKRSAVALYAALIFADLVIAKRTDLWIASSEVAEFDVPSKDGKLLLTFRCQVLTSAYASEANARAASAFFDHKLREVARVWAAGVNAGLG